MSPSPDNAVATAPPKSPPPPATRAVKGRRAQTSRGGVVMERPGMEAGTWERWHLAPGNAPRLLGENTLPKGERILLLPTARVFAWPLWIAKEGDSTDLARLELAGRHLLKRGMEESLVVLPVLEREDRRLVLAVAPEEEFPEEGLPADWSRAARFELAPRMQPGTAEADLIVWREWDATFVSFYRNGCPLWFSEVRGENLEGVVRRTALRLLAEGVIDHQPVKILVSGLPDGGSAAAVESLKKAFPKALITEVSPAAGTPNPPTLAADTRDIPPAAARRERDRKQRAGRLIALLLVAGVLYLLLTLLGAGALLKHRLELKNLQRQIAAMQAPALEGKTDSERWKELRPAVDPSAFALDLLAAAASATEGGKVRLTRFSLERGRLQISGEATDVTQAYAFIEQIRKNPMLQEYDWSAGQPQLAGKNSVRFDMEGNRSDATPGRQ